MNFPAATRNPKLERPFARLYEWNWRIESSTLAYRFTSTVFATQAQLQAFPLRMIISGFTWYLAEAKSVFGDGERRRQGAPVIDSRVSSGEPELRVRLLRPLPRYVASPATWSVLSLNPEQQRSGQTRSLPRRPSPFKGATQPRQIPFGWPKSPHPWRTKKGGFFTRNASVLISFDYLWSFFMATSTWLGVQKSFLPLFDEKWNSKNDLNSVL